MKNETAVLDCVTKMITFKFNDEIFVVDIKEGDLADSWNTITDKNGVMWDFNFSWEDTKGCRPNLSIYGLTEENGEFTINTSDEIVIDILGFPSADVFFKEERFKYQFDITSKVVCRIYNENDEVIFKTRSFNRTSDEMSIRKYRGEKVYMVLTDKNNATKMIGEIVK